MIEYKMTRQAVDMEWAPVKGAPAREMALHPPAGDDWKLHSFEHSAAAVVAVWERPRRAHEMSEIYSDAENPSAPQSPAKTISEIPEPGTT